ncbi:MAG: phosphatidylserine decarboxylase [Planctomycetes bacterium]|nr:phosphatidylserine decarboxylase [Planctomycetota bacterium]
MTTAALATPTNSILRRELPAPAVAREGWPIVAAFVLVSAGVCWGSFHFLGWIGGAASSVVCGLLTLWCVWFFRDPQRSIPQDADAVICPADGRVVITDDCAPPAELGMSGEPMRRVCIFMNVFNVHVNRCPVDGRVEKIHYRPGTFVNASFDKASTHNERSSMVVAMANGRRAVVVQIAGLIARRIVCRVKEGVSLSAGERYGLIRFGSRVDVYLPRDVTVTVRVGEVTKAGETIIARFAGSAGGRGGV